MLEKIEDFLLSFTFSLTKQHAHIHTHTQEISLSDSHHHSLTHTHTHTHTHTLSFSFLFGIVMHLTSPLSEPDVDGKTEPTRTKERKTFFGACEKK